MSSDYSAENIDILKGLDSVKARPGMYAGDVSSVAATHHLLFEVFDNAVDEALAGHASRIEVTLFADGSAGVRDDGRGIPVATHPEAGLSAAEVIFTTLHAGGKFNNDAYRASGGLHGVGISVTNALSHWLETEIVRDGAVWTARFEAGATVRPVARRRAMRKGEATGTHIRFLPSGRYLRETVFERDALARRFREVAYLNAGLEIVFADHRTADGQEAPIVETYRFDDGMADFVADIVGTGELVAPIARVAGSHDGGEVDAAFSWVGDDRPEDIRAYTNNIPQPDGGQHTTGLRTALGRALLAWAEREKLLRRASRLSAEDLREGLACALHVRLPDPAFSSQTKEKLISTEARAAVEAVVGQAFATWLDTHPEAARAIVGRAQAASEARAAAKKARELSRTKKAGKRISSAVLPEKLADCAARDAGARELFLVEGDSAGGSAKQGRDREHQAILPLRGKILNVERAKPSQAMKNAEIAAMIQTLGAGVGDRMDLSRLRYNRIVVMTDADIDGSHIATLLMTFFFRQMRPLVEAGHLYLAVPPLFRVRRRGEEDIFVRTEKALTGLFLDRALAGQQLLVDGTVLEGSGARAALDGLLEAATQAGAAARALHHPRLADAFLGEPLARPLFGSGPVGDRICRKIARSLAQTLAETDPDGDWRLDVVGEGTGYGLHAVRAEDGLEIDHSIARADLATPAVAALHGEFHATGLAGARIDIAGARAVGPISFMEALRGAGSRGATVSRYKGLGEMNPEELWETTMNPASRTMQRVTIAEAAVADRSFADLMADNVPARRALIEEMCAARGRIDI